MINGSVADDERRRLKAHLQGCEACRAEVGATLEAAELFAGHPTVDQLVALAFGEAVAAGAELEAHLEVCSDCADQLAMARQSWTLSGERAAAPQERAAAASWRFAAVAAALIAAVGMGGWVLSWHRLAEAEQAARQAASERQEVARQVGALEESLAEEKAALLAEREATKAALEEADRRAEARIAELERRRPSPSARWYGDLSWEEIVPGDVLRGEEGARAVPRLDLPASGGALMLSFLQDEDPGLAPYVLELTDASGETVWRQGVVWQPHAAAFNVLIPPSVLALLGSGEHLVTIYGEDASGTPHAVLRHRRRFVSE